MRLTSLQTDTTDGLEFDNEERPECSNLLTLYQLATLKTKVGRDWRTCGAEGASVITRRLCAASIAFSSPSHLEAVGIRRSGAHPELVQGWFQAIVWAQVWVWCVHCAIPCSFMSPLLPLLS